MAVINLKRKKSILDRLFDGPLNPIYKQKRVAPNKVLDIKKANRDAIDAYLKVLSKGGSWLS
ncbi:hypothetical protein EV05_1881 [Prochlorococcus sp. MIT 0601]|nr:hypothetical protein EV05_1881 [Prochlorococcus sp. MIT 0601]